jgi:hypothetical protein
MMILLLTVAVIAIAMGAMALGVMISGKRLKGSCGGEGGADCACALAGLKRDGRACASASASAREAAIRDR